MLEKEHAFLMKLITKTDYEIWSTKMLVNDIHRDYFYQLTEEYLAKEYDELKRKASAFIERNDPLKLA